MTSRGCEADCGKSRRLLHSLFLALSDTDRGRRMIRKILKKAVGLLALPLILGAAVQGRGDEGKFSPAVEDSRRGIVLVSSAVRERDGENEEIRTQTGFLIGNAFLSYLVAFIILIAIDAIVFLILDKGEEKANVMLRIGCILVLAMLLQWGLMHFLKRIGGRPRWRFLYELGGVWKETPYDFQNWWNFAWFKNPKNDYFKSWPSGHTATASLAILLGLLPQVMKKPFSHAELTFFGCGLLYALIVAFARILAGAHFLSDVSFGLLVGSLSAFLCLFIGSKILPEKEKPQEEPAEIPAE